MIIGGQKLEQRGVWVGGVGSWNRGVCEVFKSLGEEAAIKERVGVSRKDRGAEGRKDKARNEEQRRVGRERATHLTWGWDLL